ncbi:MAG TPA: tetratricopeptide repeat protein [Steroidobacteraceae bacterium]
MYVRLASIPQPNKACGAQAAAIPCCFHGPSQRLALEPNDNNAHLDIGLSYELMGDMLASQGKLDEALNAYQTALAKTKAAADANPKRAVLQDTIAIDYVHIGDLMQEQGKSADALSAFQTSLDIRQQLVAQDPTNENPHTGLPDGKGSRLPH